MTLSGTRRVERVVARDEQFRAFYADEYPALTRYCWRLVQDRELVDPCLVIREEARATMRGLGIVA